MIRHMRHGSPPRLMALQSILSPNRRESLPAPPAGVRITPSVEKWRLEHPHDTPPHPLTPSPTSAHTSRSCCELAASGGGPLPHQTNAPPPPNPPPPTRGVVFPGPPQGENAPAPATNPPPLW